MIILDSPKRLRGLGFFAVAKSCSCHSHSSHKTRRGVSAPKCSSAWINPAAATEPPTRQVFHLASVHMDEMRASIGVVVFTQTLGLNLLTSEVEKLGAVVLLAIRTD